MIIKEEDHLQHYGTPRHSGRYPWGSGGNAASTRNRSFLDSVEMMRKQGMSETEIARGLGITTTQLRAKKTIARAERKQEQIDQAQRLKDKGYSNVAIGERMGLNESSVRSLLAPGSKDKANVLETTSSMLKSQVDKKGYLDVGSGVENHVGVSRDKLQTAVAMLQEQGYKVHYFKVEQVGTGKQTTIKVLAKGDSPFPKRDQIKSITDFSDDGGRSFLGLHPPISVNSRRIGINYAEDGGADADGVIYIRPGVKDLSIGNARYAQVRIAVDGTHYLKGMAMYKDDLPEGTDLVFNTSAKNTGRKKDAMKLMKDDPDNPFGAIVRQRIEKGPDGRERVTSAMNIVNEEGNWENWSRSLSSQFLSKQNPALAKTQLNYTYETRKNQLDEILSLTNPTVRKKLLETYADATDAAAVHLKAAALPRQASHVILPIKSMKPGEVYAPNYRNGERVVLVRYPHGGTFEIPELKVNNRHSEARKLIGSGAKDAIGIHHKVAERLSGADFDGDTVLVIPNDRGSVKTSPALEGLKGFDPRSSYPKYPGMKVISPSRKQQEMGNVTNLIADMTIRGANSEELARAIRHSMVVIDSEKHELDYKGSYAANGIAQLKEKYQGKTPTGKLRGASTLITKASSEVRVPERKPRSAAKGGPIDPVTGRKVYEETGRTYINKMGKTVSKTTKTTRLGEAHVIGKGAEALSSGTAMEQVYVEHSNKLNALSNTARKAAVSTKGTPYSPSAKVAYSNEVASLNAKLNLALKNAPLERQAQVLANTQVSQRRQANPAMDPADVKKIKSQALTEARVRTGAKKQMIVLTQREWDAIQAGAISNHKLTQIINNSDLDTVKKLATPKRELKMTPTKRLRAQAMLGSGYTQAEVADALGVSLTTLKTSISE
jgi:DNA-binding CsgD family transcriptional regulator